MTEIRSADMRGARTENFCKERRRLKEIFLPCGFSAREHRRCERKNRAGDEPPMTDCGGNFIGGEISRKGAISP